MADIELVIKISEEEYINIKNAINSLIENGVERASMSKVCLAILDGTQLPKGHGRLIDGDEIASKIDGLKDNWNRYGNEYESGRYESYDYAVDEIVDAPTIIETDKKYEVEIITRGNCMMCGKELDEGLFFCKECEEKAESEDKE